MKCQITTRGFGEKVMQIKRLVPVTLCSKLVRITPKWGRQLFFTAITAGAVTVASSASAMTVWDGRGAYYEIDAIQLAALDGADLFPVGSSRVRSSYTPPSSADPSVNEAWNRQMGGFERLTGFTRAKFDTIIQRTKVSLALAMDDVKQSTTDFSVILASVSAIDTLWDESQGLGREILYAADRLWPQNMADEQFLLDEFSDQVENRPEMPDVYTAPIH